MTAAENKLESLAILLRSLKLPTIARLAQEIAQQAEREGWTFQRYLHHLAELEVEERGGQAGALTEPVVPPLCMTKLGHPAIPWSPASDLSVSETFQMPYAIFATRPEQHSLALAWKVGPAPSDGWTPWFCFDQVIHPERTAACNDTNREPEVFATSSSGKLYYRHDYETYNGWLPWTELPSPCVGAPIADVAAAGLPGPAISVYVACAEEIFVRTKLVLDSQLVFGPWRSLGAIDARRLAVLTDQAGVHAVFALTTDARLMTSTGTPHSTEGSFSSWAELPIPDNPIAIDVGQQAGARSLYVVDEAGALWVCRGGSGCDWLEAKGADSAPELMSTSVGSHGDEPPILFGIDRLGIVHRLIDRADELWIPMQ